MCGFCSSAEIRNSDAFLVTSLREFDASLSSTSGPPDHSLRNAAALLVLSTGLLKTYSALIPLYIHDALPLKVGPHSSRDELAGSCAWLVANSSIFTNQMSDATPKIAVDILFGFDQRDSRTHCLCGASIDKLWHHSRVCPLQCQHNADDYSPGHVASHRIDDRVNK